MTHFSAFLRRFGASITIGTLLFAAIFSVNMPLAHAATIWTVTTTADDAAGGTCSTTCTLRDALHSAQNGDTIQFQSGVTGTIKTGSAGTLTVATSVTITGPGMNSLTIDGSINGSQLILIVNSGVNASISGLTIAHASNTGEYYNGGGIINYGTLTVSNSTFSGNSVGYNNGGGGGIANTGTLTVKNSTFSGNSTGNEIYAGGGGIFNTGTLTISDSTFSGNTAGGNGHYGGGGGIFNGGILTISNSIFSGNSATGGGGIANHGMLTVSNSTFSGNSDGSGGGGGGGILNDSFGSTATITISNSTFSNNSAGIGGGILNGGALTIGNSIFSGNSASGGGGASIGGGILNRETLTVSNSTFSGNSSTGQGGGIDNDSSGSTAILTLSNSTVSNNSASFNGGGVSNKLGSLYLFSDIVAKNTTSGNGPNVYISGGTVASIGYNLIGDGTSSGITPVTGDQIGTSSNPIDPKLAALADNGGSTQTMALLTGSSAIGNGNCGGNASVTPPALAVTTDQRGVARVNTGSGLGCDIGAYESHLSPNTATPTPTNSATFTPTNTLTNTATATVTPTSTTTGTPTSTVTNTATATTTNTPTPAKIDTIGIYRSGTFYLRLHNTTGFADTTVGFNPAGKNLPVVGDWTGSGFDAIGVFDQNTAKFTLCTANVTSTCANVANQIAFNFGNGNDTPLSGRWQLSATHAGVGVFRPSNGILYLKNALSSGFADYGEVLGIPGDEGVAGDWTGKGFDSPGIYRPSQITFYLSNVVTSGQVFGNISLTFGSATDLPITGDWIAQGHDGIGMFRPTNGYVYLKNALTSGFADSTFFYGLAGDQPIAGHWQVTYPPIAPAPVLIAKTAAPNNSGGGIVPGGSQIGG